MARVFSLKPPVICVGVCTPGDDVYRQPKIALI